MNGGQKITIPNNDLGIKPGSYSIDEIVDLIRKYSDNKEAVYFIVNRMEE